VALRPRLNSNERNKMLGYHEYDRIWRNFKEIYPDDRYPIETFKPLLKDLECRLSPENLHCDGEISQREAEFKHRCLMRHWESIEKKVGRAIFEDEIYDL